MPRLLAAILTFVALLWCAAIVLAPLALTSGRPVLTMSAAIVYRAAGLVCHQRPERSFHLGQVQQPVCARCFGLYLSGTVAALIAWLATRSHVVTPRFARSALVLCAVPTAVTVAAEFVGLAHPSSLVRALSALPLGAAAGWVFVRSLMSDQ